MRDRLTKMLPPVLSFAAVLLLWQGAVWVFRPAPFLLPGIDRVAERLVTFGANWPKHVFATVERIVLGFAVATVSITSNSREATLVLFDCKCPIK